MQNDPLNEIYDDDCDVPLTLSLVLKNFSSSVDDVDDVDDRYSFFFTVYFLRTSIATE